MADEMSQEGKCVTMGHEDRLATSVGLFDVDGHPQNVAYCDECARALAKDGDYTEIARLAPPNHSDAHSAQHDDCARCFAKVERLEAEVARLTVALDVAGNRAVACRWTHTPESFTTLEHWTSACGETFLDGPDAFCRHCGGRVEAALSTEGGK